MSRRAAAGNHVPAMVQLLHEHPEVRESFPIADALDMAARWSA